MSFLEFVVFSQVSARRGVIPSKLVNFFKVNHAPRKFKNLGTDAFIASWLEEFISESNDVNVIKV